MKTKQAFISEPVVDHDTSTSPQVWSEEEFTLLLERAQKLRDTAEPAEILEKPFQTKDGHWLTAEEVLEYTKTFG